MNGCNLEWQPYIRDFQWGIGLDPTGPVDLTALEGAKQDLQQTGLYPPPPSATVRATYDARLINSYDFAWTAPNIGANNNALWTVGWQVPLGYRAVVRRYEILYDGDLGGAQGNSLAIPLQVLYPNSETQISAGGVGFNQVYAAGGNGVPVANAGWTTIGPGGGFDCFFLVEEGVWFGAMGANGNLSLAGTCFVSVNVFGQLIPVTQNELPYCIGNPIS